MFHIDAKRVWGDNTSHLLGFEIPAEYFINKLIQVTCVAYSFECPRPPPNGAGCDKG